MPRQKTQLGEHPTRHSPRYLGEADTLTWSTWGVLRLSSGCRCCKDGWPARLSLEELGRGSGWKQLTGAFVFDNNDSGRSFRLFRWMFGQS